MPVVHSPADGTELRFDVHGEGPPLVLLHGSVLSQAIWRGLGYLELLAAEHRVIRMDLRGHGRSGRPHGEEAYHQDTFVADLLAVMDGAGAPEASVLGYSLGARIGISAAIAHPERITRLVSLGGSTAAQSGAVEKVFFPGVIDAVRSGGMEAFCSGQGLGADAPSRRDQATRTAFLQADHQAMAALFTATEATPAIPDRLLEACEVPALWMAGTQDHPRLAESRHAAELMPRGRFVPLQGRTHGRTLSPAAEVLEHVVPFLH